VSEQPTGGRAVKAPGPYAVDAASRSASQASGAVAPLCCLSRTSMKGTIGLEGTVRTPLFIVIALAARVALAAAKAPRAVPREANRREVDSSMARAVGGRVAKRVAPNRTATNCFVRRYPHGRPPPGGLHTACLSATDG
jgi:hypothetical protein